MTKQGQIHASASAGGPGPIMLEIIGATRTRTPTGWVGSGARLSHVSGQGVPPARNETSCKAGPRPAPARPSGSPHLCPKRHRPLPPPCPGGTCGPGTARVLSHCG